MSNIFRDFSDTLEDVALEWPSDRTALDSDPATRGAFEEAATTALLQVKATDTEKFARFSVSEQAEAGANYSMRMINRFLFLSSVTALHKGYTVTDFMSIARNPRTIEAMTTLAKQKNKVAARVETRFNLKGRQGGNYYIDDLDAVRESFDIKDGAVVIRGFDVEVARHSYHVNMQLADMHPPEEVKKMREKQGCPAHKSEALVPIYKSLVLISLKDPSLSTAVMSLQKRSELSR
ncbi:MAG: hypothetical protein Q7T74_02770 [Candidatus Saccharibacteria bacterium]|nr:hypothetical protein [Candidatus Saccharibacteria bacterium]